MLIEDGKGTGVNARVDSTFRLQTNAKSSSVQHIASEEREDAFQVIGTATAAAATVTLLHIQNNDTEKPAVLSYIRLQNITLAGGTAIPSAVNYFSISLGRTYVSGGTAATPINTKSGSVNPADVTIYYNAPVLAGTALEIDRWYPTKDGDIEIYNKEGALILPAGQTLEVSFIGDHTSGTLYSRASFFMEPEE